MRRLLLLVVVLSAVGFATVKLRERATSTPAGEPATWPPIPPRPDPAPAVAERPTDAPGLDEPVAWKPVNADGTMPDGYPIKAKSQSMIFHVPSGRFYERTRAERCYATEAAAVADGYRRSKA